jgi:hypothetical protein
MLSIFDVTKNLEKAFKLMRINSNLKPILNFLNNLKLVQISQFLKI